MPITPCFYTVTREEECVWWSSSAPWQPCSECPLCPNSVSQIILIPASSIILSSMFDSAICQSSQWKRNCKISEYCLSPLWYVRKNSYTFPKYSMSDVPLCISFLVKCLVYECCETVALNRYAENIFPTNAEKWGSLQYESHLLCQGKILCYVSTVQSSLWSLWCGRLIQTGWVGWATGQSWMGQSLAAETVTVLLLSMTFMGRRTGLECQRLYYAKNPYTLYWF